MGGPTACPPPAPTWSPTTAAAPASSAASSTTPAWARSAWLCPPVVDSGRLVRAGDRVATVVDLPFATRLSRIAVAFRALNHPQAPRKPATLSHRRAESGAGSLKDDRALIASGLQRRSPRRRPWRSWPRSSGPGSSRAGTWARWRWPTPTAGCSPPPATPTWSSTSAPPPSRSRPWPSAPSGSRASWVWARWRWPAPAAPTTASPTTWPRSARSWRRPASTRGPALPPTLPTDRSARERVDGPAAVYHNCSGKHAYMLAGSVVQGWAPERYTEPDHPPGGRRRHPRRLRRGPDRARRRRRLRRPRPRHAPARPGHRLRPPRRPRRPGEEGPAAVVEAVRRHPFMLSGTGQLDTILIEATGGRVLAKVGAEATYAAVDLSTGTALALKVSTAPPRPRRRPGRRSRPRLARRRPVGGRPARGHGRHPRRRAEGGGGPAGLDLAVAEGTYSWGPSSEARLFATSRAWR